MCCVGFCMCAANAKAQCHIKCHCCSMFCRQHCVASSQRAYEHSMNVWRAPEIWRRFNTCNRLYKSKLATVSGCYTPMRENYMRKAKLRHQEGAAGSSSANLGDRVRTWHACRWEGNMMLSHWFTMCPIYSVGKQNKNFTDSVCSSVSDWIMCMFLPWNEMSSKQQEGRARFGRI